MKIRVKRWPNLTTILVLAATVPCTHCILSGNIGYDGEDAGGNASDGGTPDTGEPTTLDAGAPDCTELECAKPKCSGVNTTTVSGVAYAPNGKLPLYNALVYVPSGPLEPITAGVTCDRCAPLEDTAAKTRTDSQGRFTLKDMPAGSKIPLVVQIGKWRRETFIHVDPCVDNLLTDPDLTRLPTSQAEGSMPHIAMVTGSCDSFTCIPVKLGVDPYEIGLPGSGTAISMYAGQDGFGPPGISSAPNLWDDLSVLKGYDMVLLPCECAQAPTNRGSASYKAMSDYLDLGGRVLTTDYEVAWFRNAPDDVLKKIVTIGNADETNAARVERGFPKGVAFADWLFAVGASAPYGTFQAPTLFPEDRAISADDSAVVWGSIGTKSAPTSPPFFPKVISINTPAGLPAAQQCGKGVFFDYHIFPPSHSSNLTFWDQNPGLCMRDLEPEDAVPAFFMFEGASCIQDDQAAPAAP